MNLDDAEEYTAALGQVVSGGWRQVALGVRLGVPQALGLTTREWVEDRLGGYVRLAIEERRVAVGELTAEGMTQREVADVVGVDHRTVGRDLTGAFAPPDDHEQERSRAAGADAPQPSNPDEQERLRLAEEARQRRVIRDNLTTALMLLDPLGLTPEVLVRRWTDRLNGDIDPQACRRAIQVLTLLATALEDAHAQT